MNPEPPGGPTNATSWSSHARLKPDLVSLLAQCILSFPPSHRLLQGCIFPLSFSVPHAYFSFCCPYPLLSLVLDGRTSVLVDGRLYACHACTHHPFSHHPCSPDSRGEICVFDGAFRTPVSSRFFVYQPVLFHLSPPPSTMPPPFCSQDHMESLPTPSLWTVASPLCSVTP